ncbi:unnamed protein product [Umbelopsis ramanniana]
MSSIINQARQYVLEHSFEVATSVITVAGFGLYLAWWKSAEDRDLYQEPDVDPTEELKPSQPVAAEKPKAAKVVRPPPPPPKDDLITADYLAKCDGHNPEFPIYVAIRGEVFDVSNNKDAYGPGKGYNVFCGKDSSKALGKSSLKPEDCIPDISELTETELQTLDQWYAFFSKRYPIVGKLSAEKE